MEYCSTNISFIDSVLVVHKEFMLICSIIDS